MIWRVRGHKESADGARESSSFAFVSAPLLDAIENLSRFHRQRAIFDAQDARVQAVEPQRRSRTLCALGDRWSTVIAAPLDALNPYEGSDDLNAGEAIQLDGVFFMEGQGEPIELTRIKRDLRTVGADATETGNWLADAMAATWETATASSPTTGRRRR